MEFLQAKSPFLGPSMMEFLLVKSPFLGDMCIPTVAIATKKIGIITIQRNRFKVSASVDKLLVKLTPLWSPSTAQQLYQIVEDPHIASQHSTHHSQHDKSLISGPHTLPWSPSTVLLFIYATQSFYDPDIC